MSVRRAHASAHRLPDGRIPERDEAAIDNIRSQGCQQKREPGRGIIAAARSFGRARTGPRRSPPRRSATRPRRPSGCAPRSRRSAGRASADPSPSPPTTRRDAIGQIELEQAPGRRRHEANQPESRILQLAPSPGPGSGPGRSRRPNRVPADAPTHDRGDPDAAILRAGRPPHPGRPGGAQDRTQVARVLDAVEQQDAAPRRPRRRCPPGRGSGRAARRRPSP